MGTRITVGLAAAAVAWLLLTAALAAQDGKGSGLAVPRFVSLRADEVNVRTGPGVRYPVEWVFVRRNMPVEVVAEFDTWRKIRDWQGTEGWVHKSMLSGRRMIIMTGEIRTLRRQRSVESPAVARAEPGVVGRLLGCKDDWCKVEAGGFEGWLQRSEFWGTYAEEKIE